MSAVFIAPIRRLACVGATLLCLVGCDGLRGLELKNHCATDRDCTPGRVCVAGTCRAFPDVDAAESQDSSNDSAKTDMADAGGAAGDSGDVDASHATDLSNASTVSEASDASDVSDVREASDVSDASEASDVGDASDGSGASDPSGPSDPSMTRCRADPAPGVPLSRMELAQRLVGTWQICATPVPPAALSSLAGPSGKLQLTTTAWLPLADDAADVLAGAPSPGGGAYYFLLEANERVVHFMGASAGVDVAVTVSGAGDLVSFRLCESVTACTGPPARLVSLPRKEGVDATAP